MTTIRTKGGRVTGIQPTFCKSDSTREGIQPIQQVNTSLAFNSFTPEQMQKTTQNDRKG